MTFKYNKGDAVFIINGGAEYDNWPIMQERMGCPKDKGLNSCTELFVPELFGDHFGEFDPRNYAWGEYVFYVQNGFSHPNFAANVYYVSCKEGLHVLIGETGLHRNFLMIKGTEKIVDDGYRDSEKTTF